MALLHPEITTDIRQDFGLFRELAVIERLQASLPASFEIFHSVSWFTVSQTHEQHGEIDIVVMSPSGSLLLIEVKAGEVTLRNGDIFKTYSEGERDVSRQCKTQYQVMINRLKAAKLHPFVAHCLVLPDYKIDAANLISFPKERIIGAEEYDFIGSRVQEILDSAINHADVEAVRHFLKNEFQVTTDLAALKDQVGAASHKLAEGMTVWVPRITSPSGVFSIQGTAGSGKTQLALQLISDGVAAGQKCLYVCYNRSLADHMTKIAPPRARITTFHELAVDHYKSAVGEPEYSQPGFFDKAANLYVEHSQNHPARYDLIILDEGQDLQSEWVGCLLGQLKDDGRIYLMEDEDQRLYDDREGFELNGAVIITSQENFRSPHAICQTIDAFGLASKPVYAKGPYKGDLPEFHVFNEDAELLNKTEQAIVSLLERGFKLEDIAVLSWHGRANSKLLNAHSIGQFSTKQFTGQYTADSEPIWTEGDLLTESVYRFKGQSTPAVVFTEIDFVSMTDKDRKKLFVGLTRAQMAVELVITPTTYAWFTKTLNIRFT
jgi:Holliday junction resolvase-like predicted endonuclease